MKSALRAMRIFIMVACGFFAGRVNAQLAVDSFTAHASGVSWGSYTLNGTAGQPDAGIMTGGGFTFHGGFWGGAADWGLPRVNITKRGGKFVLSWPASVNAVVQTTTSLTPPDPIWQNYPADPMRVGDHFELEINPPSHPTDSVRFFRLAQP